MGTVPESPSHDLEVRVLHGSIVIFLCYDFVAKFFRSHFPVTASLPD